MSNPIDIPLNNFNFNSYSKRLLPFTKISLLNECLKKKDIIYLESSPSTDSNYLTESINSDRNSDLSNKNESDSDILSSSNKSDVLKNYLSCYDSDSEDEDKFNLQIMMNVAKELLKNNE